MLQKFKGNNTTTAMSLRVTDKKLFKNYNKIWGKKMESIDFESKSVYGNADKYIKAKIKIYKDSLFTNFHNKKMPKENVPRKCLSINSVRFCY